MTFVGLHIHSDYSLLDGASQLPALIKRAEELEMPAIALTDHGVMYGAIELLKETKGKKIKPIIGNEMYILNGDYTQQEKRPKYHQIVLAKNLKGYQNLVNLTTISHLEGFQGKGLFARPCINKEILAEHHEGLIVTSACLGGEIPQAILQKKPEVAREIARWYQNIFGEDFYLELQDHGYAEDRVVNPEIVRIARELGIEIVMTNDSHYINCIDVEAHDALLCIMTGKEITDTKRMHYAGNEYLKSEAEMRDLFIDHLAAEIVDEAIQTTLKVANKVEDYREQLLGTDKPPNHLPKFPIPEGHTPKSYLKHLTELGLANRFPEGVPDGYFDRLEFELNVIEEMGFPNYFLVVWDYTSYARESGIRMGLGRGSAAGSLVSYSLGITNVDPIHHGLLFERFLNKFRVSMPDVDTDFCPLGRSQVIQYVTEKYGSDKVAQIITYNRMTSKAVLKDTGRVLGIPYGDADRMSKSIPVKYGKPAKLKTLIAEDSPVPEFRQRYLEDKTIRHWIDLAIQLEGVNKSSGIHAAAVVISDVSLNTLVPLERNKDGVVFTQYPMEDIEDLGLLKMDFLGLKNLTIIQKTVDTLQQQDQPIPDLDHLDMTDQPTFDLMAKGWLDGIFQLESSGMRSTVRSLKPTCIEDVSAILALYRPGPLGAGMVPSFINRKHGLEMVTYDHPLLEPILRDTYGVIVYQEAVMKISVVLAGYTLFEADNLRKIVGKKKAADMVKEKVKFLDGCDKKEIARPVSEKVWSQIEDFGFYGFNLSHSMAYAYISYQTAYLKAHYPTEYMASLLTANADDQDSVQKYLAACQQMGIKIDLPDINQSNEDFTPCGDRIRFGLSAIRNLGTAAVEAIIVSRRAEGRFESFADLCDRISINKRALEALIHAGAFDSLHPNRKQLIEGLAPVMSWASGRSRDRMSGQTSFLTLLEEGDGIPGHTFAPQLLKTLDYAPIERVRLEKDILGFYVSDHPLRSTTDINRYLNITSLAYADGLHPQTPVTIVVMISEFKEIITKKGEAMGILTLEDLSGRLSAVAFPKSYSRIARHLNVDSRLVIQGKIDRRDDQPQIIIDSVQPLDTAQALIIQISPEQCEDISVRGRIRDILSSNVGAWFESTSPVIAEVQGKEPQYVVFGKDYWIKDPSLVAENLSKRRINAKAIRLIDGI